MTGREVETAWIALADGRRLAARLFLPPEDVGPAPVILEYIPYRRRDGTRLGDEAMHRWFAAQGYAAARVDISGTGDSDGLLDDEYVLREQDDALQVIAWLAAQPWSSGAVGMIGISWGGFNGLQIAARRPPALKAVISLCSTVDRYHGDVHFTGGCLNEENLEWGSYLFTMHAMPPDPAIVGHDRWRDMWRHRIEHAILPPARWLEHQRRDEFWRHGSVVEDLSAIEVPVLAVSGWADGYTGAVFDLVEGLSSPAKGIVGPWGHKYPHDGIPGPAIGFLQEATRWWDRWLKGRPNGVNADPAMRLYLQHSHVPTGHVDERPGRWIEVGEWPPGGPIQEATWRFGSELVAAPIPPSGARSICSPPIVGIAAGQWCAYGLGKIAPELPLDQRSEDAGSLTYDSVPLAASLTIVGRPRVRLRLSSDRPHAQVAVRLNDVHPDGTSERLSYGLLNLTHRDSHLTPTPLEPGAIYDVEVPMKAMAHTLTAGHRLRVAVSTGYWPMAWPSPERVTLTVHDDESAIDLPIVDDVVEMTTAFEPAARATVGPVTMLRAGPERRWITHDLAAQRTDVVGSRDDGDYVLDDIGTRQTFTRVRTMSIGDDDPTTARTTVECRASYRRDDWNVRIESDIEMTCTATDFVLHARLATFDGDDLFIERHFRHVVPRDHI